jgi:SurA N-terminal domain
VPRIPIKLAAAALVAGVAVAACGPVKMGAAAIVGNQRITTTTLAQEASNLSAGYQAYKNQIQLQYPVSQAPQEALAWLVRFQVRERQAQREGITVTQAEAEQAIQTLMNQIRQSGSTAPLPEIAVANGLPPDMLGELGRYQAIGTMLTNRLDGGKLPTSTSAQQALQTQFNASECRAAKSLNIQINPQFGTLDYGTLAIVPATTTLSRGQGAPAPTPSASAPQLTPSC